MSQEKSYSYAFIQNLHNLGGEKKSGKNIKWNLQCPLAAPTTFTRVTNENCLERRVLARQSSTVGNVKSLSDTVL